jgi:hypothetical protein
LPLGEPPEPARLQALPARSLAGRVLHRVFRRGRDSPWWFSGVGIGAVADPSASGRFDLPLPDGACYLATSALGAVLEAFQDFGRGVLPVEELHRRSRAEITAPGSAPRAAALVSAHARGLGISQALWAGDDRALTQRWARALRRAGWRALWSGLQHDTTGRLRGVTLFDEAGEHPPYGASSWQWTTRTLADDSSVIAGLHRYGITVIAPVDPPLTSLADSGL